MSEFGKVNYDTINILKFDEATERLDEGAAALALEARFGPHARHVSRFLSIMSKHGMPDAKKLYTERPEIEYPSAIAKYLLRKDPEIKGGAPVLGYSIGTMKITGQAECRGLVFLCETGELMVYEDSVGGHDKSSTQVATALGQREYFIGRAFDYHDNLSPWQRSHELDGIKFERMTIEDVLNEITTDQLNAV